MSPRAGQVCNVSGCPLDATTAGRCAEHARAYRRPKDRAHDATRGSASQRGYGKAWAQNRASFLRANPQCLDCGEPATVADHAPTSRRDLVAAGATDPDHEQHLEPRCRSCHSRRTVLDDGGLGR